MFYLFFRLVMYSRDLFVEQKPLINELVAGIASSFPDAYNGWTAALSPETQQCLKEALS